MLVVKLGYVAAPALFAFFCGCTNEAAHECVRDLGTLWSLPSCMDAVYDPSNQTLVTAIGDEACARAKLGTSDVAVGDAACKQARAKSEKAAWIEIERAASAGTQPRLALDDLLPALPKAPPPKAPTPQPTVVDPYVQQLTIEQNKRKLLERQLRKQQRQIKQQQAELQTQAAATTPQAQPSETKRPSEDDFGLIVGACGQPDRDDSTLHQNPPPSVITRWVDYQRPGVRFIFLLSGGQFGSEPRLHYSWTILGATYGEDHREVLHPNEEALDKLPSKCAQTYIRVLCAHQSKRAEDIGCESASK
jgi:hypothetical protein